VAQLAFFAAASPATGAAPFVAGFARFADDPQAGHLLLTELSCTACHRSDDSSLEPKQGPILSSAAVRLQPEWVVNFLDSPHHAKPGTTMPDLFAGRGGDDKRRAIDALVAFLGSQRQPLTQPESTARHPVAVRFWAKGDADRGNKLYHEIGCAACHRVDSELAGQDLPNDDFAREELIELGLIDVAPPVPSVPLPMLADKYSLESLTLFLLDPLATRPAGRMPDLKLLPSEAADIATYLIGESAVEQIAPDTDPSASLVAKGKRLFSELRCASCHRIRAAVSQPTARPLEELRAESKKSCLTNRGGRLPRYDLNDDQRAALKTALRQQDVADQLTLRLLQLNCYACHQRGGRGGVGPERRQFLATVGHVDLGDEGRLPPPLDGVGRKLKTDWMKRVFDGRGDVRPFMTARMPVFGAATDGLPVLFRAADRTEQLPEDRFAAVEPSIDAGRQLMDVGCVQCHPVGGERLSGVVGVDLADIDQRVYPDWFHEFLLDPAGLKERTRMPAFFRDGKSSAPDVLGGDVDQQIASLWAYLKDADKHPLPARIQQERQHDFELVPRERPIVLRTFMDHAGPHAIAVGFPAGVHLAFDAERVRVAQFWRGRFLDAHGTWFDRFTPPAVPLGETVIDLTDPSDLTDSPDRQFGGYRLSASGVPTFLYRLDGVRVEDTFRPTNAGGFSRLLKLSAPNQAAAEAVWFAVFSGESLKPLGHHKCRNAQGLTVSVRSPAPVKTRLTTHNPSAYEVRVEPPDEIELEYQW